MELALKNTDLLALICENQGATRGIKSSYNTASIIHISN